jgi:D-xylose transport system ATP-binding protein
MPIGTTSGLDNGAAPFLQAQGIVKLYGGVRALDGVSLSLARGEVVGLVGDNGAGKSTLFKVLSGVVEADQCRLTVAGKDVKMRSVAEANTLGVYTVYQDLALCDNLDVVANLYLGMEVSHPWCSGARLDRPSMERRAREVLATLGVKIPALTSPVGGLSGGQRQGIAIARALLRDPQIILLDEPTAALGVEQTANVLEMIRRLKAEGRGVAIVSHNLRDVLSVADRAVVLRLGRIARIFNKGSFDEDKIVAAITGSRLSTASMTEHAGSEQPQ